jgi:hypothetical protein
MRTASHQASKSARQPTSTMPAAAAAETGLLPTAE